MIERRKGRQTQPLGYLPASTIARLTAAADPGGVVPERYRPPLAGFMQRCITPTVRHERHRDCVPMGRDEWREWFGGNRPLIGWVQENVAEKPDEWYSMDRGIGKAYRLRREVLDRLYAVESTAGPPEEAIIVDMGGKPLSRAHAVAHPAVKTAAKRAAGRLPTIPAWVPVNMDALEATRAELLLWIHHLNGRGPRPRTMREEMAAFAADTRYEHAKDPGARKPALRRKLERVLSEVTGFVEAATNTRRPGEIPQTYRQSAAGRWYGQGPNLQGCTRLARNAALHGSWQFDMDCCHHTIALHHAKEGGIPTPMLARYVEHKTAVRIEIAEHVGAPVRAVKVACLAIVYGATRSRRGALVETLTANGMARALTHEVFAGMWDELHEVFRYMLESAERDRQGRIVNALGLVDDDDPTDKRQVAHLFQGEEAKALQAALAAHQSALTAEHDGWSTRGQEDERHAEAAILSATGIPMIVEGKRHRISGFPDDVSSQG